MYSIITPETTPMTTKEFLSFYENDISPIESITVAVEENHKMVDYHYRCFQLNDDIESVIIVSVGPLHNNADLILIPLSTLINHSAKEVISSIENADPLK